MVRREKETRERQVGRQAEEQETGEVVTACSLSQTDSTCLALSDSFLQTAATSRVSVGNLCWQ